jgi:CelD/BcsL family acetyltransferase involved in cellulose biosynthesis
MDAAVSRHPARDLPVAAARQGAGPIARIQVFDNLRAAEPVWRRLEAGRALATPYQRFDLLAAWQRHVGAPSGMRACVIAGYDAIGEPVLLWPFGCRQVGPLRVLVHLGSKHANFNIGLWRRDVVGSITADHIRAILGGIADQGQRVDLAALLFQPARWDGCPNPFLLLPHQPAVDACARLTIPRPGQDGIAELVSAATRGRLRQKERKLERLPGYRYLQATATEEIDRLLDAFFALKATHMAAQGLSNVFAGPGVAAFLRQACHSKGRDGRALIELHALVAAGQTLAVCGAVADDYRLSANFNTYTLGAHARHSPGLILLQHMIGDCAARGIRSFDIGVGGAHYKTVFCKEPEPLHDAFVPLSVRGQLAAPLFAAAHAGKRAIKRHPGLWSAVQSLRRLRARHVEAAAAAHPD